MSNVKNIIDTLKNQGANPDLFQINLIKKLCKMKISKKFSFKKYSTKITWREHIFRAMEEARP